MNRHTNYQLPITLLLLAIVVTSCSTPVPSTPITTPSVPPNINIIFPTEPPPCTTLTTAPTPQPSEADVFPPESADDHMRGADKPSVTIIEYSDYADARSALLAEVLRQMINEHPNDLRVVSRIFPILGENEKAALSALAAQAAQAASEQGKFWEMHDLLYSGQANWVNLSAEGFERWIIAQASGLGMDAQRFQSDLKREDIVADVQKAWTDGQKLGIPFTPFVLINGQIYTGPRDHASMNDIVGLIAFGKRQFTSCPPITVDRTKQYLATLHTEKGDVVIQLFPDKAPITVNSFIYLAQNGWYDNITFHRVVADMYAQTGDPSGTGKGNPGYYIITEILPTLTFDRPGMVAMVNSGPDTSGSQFFITTASIPQFNGQYTIFGQVLSGMDVVKALTPRNAQPGVEVPPGDKLLSVTIQEK
jgi:cyclophilin family peptidyl-prolyl cis-trans isomerase/protein-disulfide isomerase